MTGMERQSNPVAQGIRAAAGEARTWADLRDRHQSTDWKTEEQREAELLRRFAGHLDQRADMIEQREGGDQMTGETDDY